jgi:hypothetical protein
MNGRFSNSLGARTGIGRGWTVAVLWGLGAYGIHKLGAVTGLYLQYGWYQNLTHACSASAMAALLAVAGLSLGYRGRRLAGFVVVASLLGAVGWEVLEFFSVLDAYGIWLHFHGFHDAAVDMGANAVGVAATLGVLRTVGRPGGRE